MLLPQLTTTMVAVALPSILAGLDLSLERAGWIIAAYLLPMAILMPTWGAAGDLYGRRRVFRLGLLLFGLGALLAAAAGGLPLLLAGQALQAVGASALNPIGTALLAESSGPRARGRTLGRLRMILSLAGIAGAPLGGLLVQAAGWPAVYLAGPVIALLVAGLLGRLPPEPAPAAPAGAPFDRLGALLLSLTVLALLAALWLGPVLGWTAPPVLALASLTLAGLALLGPVEARQPRPVLPPALLRRPAIVAVILTALLYSVAFYPTPHLAPLLLQRGLGLAPAEVGWLLACFPLGMAASGLPAGRLADRFGGRTVTVGALLGSAAGLALLLLAARAGQPALFAAGALTLTAATGAGLVAMSAYTLQQTPAEQRGIGMGFFTMITYVGEAIGVTLLPLLLAGRAGATLAAAFETIYLLAIGLTLLALVPALAMRTED